MGAYTITQESDIETNEGTSLTAVDGIIHYYIGARCDNTNSEDGAIVKANGNRDYAIRLKLESGGTYCLDNN